MRKAIDFGRCHLARSVLQSKLIKFRYVASSGWLRERFINDINKTSRGGQFDVGPTWGSGPDEIGIQRESESELCKNRCPIACQSGRELRQFLPGELKLSRP
ncbi:hypothetical protein GWI33_011924 [Rhynchophorus ferrugineus]|uniref:Uncharacterized protein n=1 Tax=Rhynchophorus ferrugineus TaxID=354439 RepID=A0A834MIK1_RHYFE|nr:hypothetical protein GWI33_011924 [Rhynchophorus ferrugineus]